MQRFKKEFNEGQIQIRDKLQFELKSDFSPVPSRKHNVYTQEFYLFIPNALQINQETYSKNQFYRDCTNFIRYKTPQFTLRDLISPDNARSPLIRLKQLCSKAHTDDNILAVEDELKLFANIVRSALRKQVRKFINTMSPAIEHSEKIAEEVIIFLDELEEVRRAFSLLTEKFSESYLRGLLQPHFYYVEEFITSAVDYHLTGLLYTLGKCEFPETEKIKKTLRKAISKTVSSYSEDAKTIEKTLADEYFLYQKGLLNKFVLDALLLNVSRTSSQKRYRNLIGSLAAGIAMLLYLIVFIWQGNIFVINSAPFVIVTVILYIVKDRIKEGMKTLYHRKASRWFSDYTTKIRTPDGEGSIGTLKEVFSFVAENDLPKEITRVRNKEFHAVLEVFKRPETVIYYKKEINILGNARPKGARRYQLNNIFRFNIHRFLEKASNPYHKYLILPSEGGELREKSLPKVYHVNIIMRNSYLEKDGSQEIELHKFRLIIDKDGIKRIEKVTRT